jgi:hypothetical protein
MVGPGSFVEIPRGTHRGKHGFVERETQYFVWILPSTKTGETNGKQKFRVGKGNVRVLPYPLVEKTDAERVGEERCLVETIAHLMRQLGLTDLYDDEGKGEAILKKINKIL